MSYPSKVGLMFVADNEGNVYGAEVGSRALREAHGTVGSGRTASVRSEEGGPARRARPRVFI